MWTGPQSPNKTKVKDSDAGCGTGGNGCLFNIQMDPTEHYDLAKSQPGLLANLTRKLAAVVSTQFQTGADEYHGNYTNCTTLAEIVKVYPGFGAPLCYAPN